MTQILLSHKYPDHPHMEWPVQLVIIHHQRYGYPPSVIAEAEETAARLLQAGESGEPPLPLPRASSGRSSVAG